MEAAEILSTTGVEDRHWWYRERRSILLRQSRLLGRPGRALEIGAAGGGNSLLLQQEGWEVLATEYLEAGVRIARSRGLRTIQADARALPIATASRDLLVAFDVLEHIDRDDRAAAEIFRVLRPGGTAVIAVPCDMRLWSDHDVLSGHHRRYSRQSLTALIEGAGLSIEQMWSWNVLMRPALALRRTRLNTVDNKRATPALTDVTDVPPLLNSTLGAVVRLERWLPVGSLPGVSLMVRAQRPVGPPPARPATSQPPARPATRQPPARPATRQPPAGPAVSPPPARQLPAAETPRTGVADS